jgi:RNA polymerase sigma factor (sigma-70 family)
MTIINFYTDCIKQHKLLTAKQEVELSKKAAQGDTEARDILINSNIRLVISIAKKYAAHGHDIDDLVQEGMMGLMKGVEKFDPSMGYRLSTYSTWWIKQTISRYIYDRCKTIRLPVHINEKISKIKNFINQYKKNHNSTPTILAISKGTKIPKDQIEDLIIMNKPTHSIEDTLNQDSEDLLLLDVLTTGNNGDNEVYIANIKQAAIESFQFLSVREEKILRLKYRI